MYPRPPEPSDLTSKQPRRIPWTRWLLYAGGVFLVFTAAGYLWIRSYTTITVAGETTYLATPLAADGYPDYIAYLNSLNAQGITPENNSWIPLLRGFDSDDLDDKDRARHCISLGIPEQTLQPGAFQPFRSKAFGQGVPDKVLVASSVAAQWPWHVRFARSLALNIEKHAQAISDGSSLSAQEEPTEEATVHESVQELATSTASLTAEIITEIADDPETAIASQGMEPLEYVDPNLVTDQQPYADLRDAALTAVQPPGLTTPGEIAAWRKSQFDLARTALFEREAQIIEERSWSRAECPLAAHWLDTQSANFDRLLGEVTARPKFYAPYLQSDDPEDRSANAIVFPGAWQLGSMSYFLQARAHQAIERGDLDAALRDVDAQLRLSTYFPAHPLMIDALVPIWTHGAAMKTIAAIVDHPQVTDTQLAAIARRLEQPHPFPNTLQSLAALRFVYLDVVVTLAARGGSGQISLQHYPRAVVCWDDVLRHINGLFDRMLAAAKQKDWQGMESLKQEMETLYSRTTHNTFLPSQRTAYVKNGVPYSTMQPVFHYYGKALQAEVEHDAALVLVALERFRRANKTYPAALPELVPKYLAAVPNDPFDGSPLKYFRTDAGGYRAYSVATNQVDDGGDFHLNDEVQSFSYRLDFVIGSSDELPRKLNLAW